MGYDPPIAVATTAQVYRALRRVVDPCSIATGAPVDLVDMGLVQEVEVTGRDAVVTLRLTSPMCWQAVHIASEVERVLTEVDGVEQVVVRVDPAAEWLPEMMAPEAWARLRRLRPLPVTGSDPAAAARTSTGATRSGRHDVAPSL